jgi:signal transduction histidine kinase
MGVQLEPVDVGSLLSEILKDMSVELRDRKAEVKVEEPLPKVLAHRVMLTQAIMNLVSNAVKFVTKGAHPRVRLRAEKKDGRARLWVEDQGIGIDSNQRDRIFGVFQRLNRSEEYPGTGIGLAIVKRAIERMGAASGSSSRKRRESHECRECRPAPGRGRSE